MEHLPPILLISYLSTAITLQLGCGNFPLSFVAFPVNIALAVALCVGLFILYREKPKSIFVRSLGSGICSIICIGLLILGSFVIALFPQDSEIVSDSFFYHLGVYNFTTSWIFISILILLFSNLTLVILRYRSDDKKKEWRFRLNHIGLWLALVGTVFGVSDTQKWRTKVYRDVPTQIAYDNTGHQHALGYKLQMQNFETKYYDNGMPSSFKAQVLVGNDRTMIEVNSPYTASWDENIYLTDFDSANGNDAQYCILEIVKQPWRYVTTTGILLMAAGALLLFIYGSKKSKTALP